MNEENNWNSSDNSSDNGGWKNDGWKNDGWNNNNQNDHNQNNWNNGNPYGNGSWSAPVREPNQGMYTASLVLGVLTIVTAAMMTVYLPFILGGLSIIFAILSRGKLPQLPRQAKTGIMLAIIGLAFNIAVTGTTFYKLFNDPEYKEEVNSTFEQMYGESFDDMLQDIQENGGYDL